MRLSKLAIGLTVALSTTSIQAADVEKFCTGGPVVVRPLA